CLSLCVGMRSGRMFVASGSSEPTPASAPLSGRAVPHPSADSTACRSAELAQQTPREAVLRLRERRVDELQGVGAQRLAQHRLLVTERPKRPLAVVRARTALPYSAERQS